MSAYHYLDENNKPCGPVDEAKLRELAETARGAGRDMMIAKPGDRQWLPFSKAFAAGGTGAAPAPAPAAAPQRPQQLVRPAPAAAHPAPATVVRPAAQPAQQAAPEPAPATTPEPQPEQPAEQVHREPAAAPAHFIKPKIRPHWIAISGYVVAGISAFLLLAVIVAAVIAAFGSGVQEAQNTASGFVFPGSAPAPVPASGGGAWSALWALIKLDPLTFVLMTAPPCLILAVFFACAGKVVSSLHQISHNTRY